LFSCVLEKGGGGGVNESDFDIVEKIDFVSGRVEIFLSGIRIVGFGGGDFGFVSDFDGAESGGFVNESASARDESVGENEIGSVLEYLPKPSHIWRILDSSLGA